MTNTSIEFELSKYTEHVDNIFHLDGCVMEVLLHASFFQSISDDNAITFDELYLSFFVSSSRRSTINVGTHYYSNRFNFKSINFILQSILNQFSIAMLAFILHVFSRIILLILQSYFDGNWPIISEVMNIQLL